eukprot:69586-Rhodomonas_salina.1
MALALGPRSQGGSQRPHSWRWQTALGLMTERRLEGPRWQASLVARAGESEWSATAKSFACAPHTPLSCTAASGTAMLFRLCALSPVSLISTLYPRPQTLDPRP